MTRRPILREITVFLGLCVLTAIMTWPWVLHLRDAVSDKGDPYLHTYFTWWDYHQTFNDPMHLFDATIFYPYKNTLAFSENDYGVALPFFPLYALGFRPITVFSLATLIAFAFSGYGMFRLTRTLTGSNSAAWIAAIVFAFVPYHFQRLPHLPLIFAGWIPLVLEAMILFARRRTWSRAAWLAFAFLMNALTCVYWFTLTLVPFALSGVFLIWWFHLGRDRDLWRRGGLALGIAVVAVSGFLYPYYRVHKMYGFARDAADAITLSARPINWLAVSERNKLWKGLGGTLAADEVSLFPGLLPPLLALGAFFLVSPISKKLSEIKSRKSSLLSRRVLLIVWDVVTLGLLVMALLTRGFGHIRIQLFGMELFRNSSPTRPLVGFLILLVIRFVLAPPEIVRRIREKNFFTSFRANPRAATVLLAIIWGVTGFFGSLGMNFPFHRFLFAVLLPFRSIRAPARWAMICYVGLAILAGWGAVQLASLIRRWHPRVPRALVYGILMALMLFEQRVAPLQFAHGDVDPDALTLRLKQTPMSGGLVELPAEKDSYAYQSYVLRAADHGRPIITASSSFAPPFVQQIESLTLARPIPDSLIDLLETIPASYLVVHNSLLNAQSRYAIESFVSRGMASGRIRFINSYGNQLAPDDLYAITRTEPNARTEVANRISASDLFVRQQYLDILHREPEPTEAEKWTGLLNGCQGESSCVLQHRIVESLGLFHSREFQDTSGFVYWLYRTALGRAPKYLEWEQEMNELISRNGKNRGSFTEGWTSRPEFLNQYPATLSNTEYVDKLLQTSGQKSGQAERAKLIEAIDQGKLSRAGMLLNWIESSAAQRPNEEAFVTLCYFVYLKRDPDPQGYNYWLQIQRSQTQGESALILGFFNSGEYRARFGQP